MTLHVFCSLQVMRSQVVRHDQCRECSATVVFCMFVLLCVCLCFYPSVCLSLCLSFCVFVFTFVLLCVCLYTCPSVCLSICLSFCVFVFMSVLLCLCLHVYPSVCLSVYLFCVFVCISVLLCICPYVCPSVYLSLYLSFCVFVFMFVLCVYSVCICPSGCSILLCACLALYSVYQTAQRYGWEERRCLITHPGNHFTIGQSHAWQPVLPCTPWLQATTYVLYTTLFWTGYHGANLFSSAMEETTPEIIVKPVEPEPTDQVSSQWALFLTHLFLLFYFLFRIHSIYFRNIYCLQMILKCRTSHISVHCSQPIGLIIIQF